MVLLTSTGYNFIQYFSRIRSLLLADFGFQFGDQAPQLHLGYSNIKADVDMGLKLCINPGHAGQSGNGRDFPTLKIEVVASKDITE